MYQFGPERVHYFLTEESRDRGIISDGPLHLSLTFFSLRSAQN
jgi:hypothetical protein